jgi:hypothetical protein
VALRKAIIFHNFLGGKQINQCKRVVSDVEHKTLGDSTSAECRLSAEERQNMWNTERASMTVYYSSAIFRLEK